MVNNLNKSTKTLWTDMNTMDEKFTAKNFEFYNSALAKQVSKILL